jgi:hypothetical protein
MERGGAVNVTGRTLADPFLDALRPLVVELLEPLERRLEEFERQLDGVRSKQWYTLEEAAERWGCTYDAARMRVKRGPCEVRYYGRRVYVSAESVDRL